MLIDGNSIKKSKQYDICIVGAGVAGIVLACELIDSGKKVALIESGGEQFNQLAQALNKANSFPPHFPDPHYSRLRFLGGSSNHWQNNTSPFSPIDFKVREGIKHSGWPIEFKEINKYYNAAQMYCGVGEDGYDANYWAKKLGGKLATTQNSNLETRIAKTAFPPTRFYSKHGSQLVNSNNIEVITHSTLVDIDYSITNESVDAAHFKTHEGNVFSVKAAKYVLALGGIENPRMLLHFNQKFDSALGNRFNNLGHYFMEHPTPRAAQLFTDTPELFEFYQGRALGDRYVIGFLSLSDKLVEAEQTINLRMPLQPQTNYTLSDGISSFHVFSDALSKAEWPDFAGRHLLNMITDWDMLTEAIARKKFDKKLFDDAGKIGGFQIPMMMEQTPNFNNSIQLSTSKDKFGIPKVNINYKISNADKNRVWRSLELVAKEIGISGIGRLKTLKERSSRIWADQLGYSNHHMGTTKMSDSPENGVVDKNLKVHGTKNLYVAGSSTFPTGGHVPPTLTIAAFSVRLAEHLA